MQYILKFSDKLMFSFQISFGTISLYMYKKIAFCDGKVLLYTLEGMGYWAEVQSDYIDLTFLI